MEAQHVKGPMDGVGGTIKNQVLKEVKFRRLSISALKEFAEFAQKLIPPIMSLYLPVNSILDEPEDIANAPAIPDTFQIRRLKRRFNQQGFT